MSSSLQCSLEAIVSEVDLPVIDFSKFPQDLDGEELSHLQDYPILARLREACTEWGYFRLVNHGVVALCAAGATELESVTENGANNGFIQKING
ncbi:hypothetical protein SUGI_0852190 [Cryptomeria japonica]|nr:hypothetical protein SUGI_0852190 [Cryptomeria japonica]